jgi:AAT family amino acid transporter
VEPSDTALRPPPAQDQPPPAAPVTTRALLSLTVVVVLAVGTWWLFLDPRWGWWSGSYGNLANAFIFWTLFAIVCLAFNGELWGFDRLPQPTRGLAFALASFAIGAGITALLALAWGQVDPSFSADRAGGVGYFTGAVFVLFAFLTNVPAATTFVHRPWRSLGLAQPWLGLAEIAVSGLLSGILWCVFAAPALTTWTATKPIFGTNMLVGLFYSVVVSVILTSNHTDHWPWIDRGTGSLRWVAGRIVGNIAIGVVLFFVLRTLAGLLLGASPRGALGQDGLSIFPAELGVCWVFWSIFWANCVDNAPTSSRPATARAARVLVTLVLAVITFTAYYHGLAAHVLHEPSIGGGASGNALGFMDWLIVWLLLYAVGAANWRPTRHRTHRPTVIEDRPTLATNQAGVQ